MVKKFSKNKAQEKQADPELRNKNDNHDNKQDLQEEDSEEMLITNDDDENSENNGEQKESDLIESPLDDYLRKVAELQDKYIRLSAEFDNYRKRTLKEKSDLIQSAGSDFLLKILPVIDNFERALNILDEAKDMEAVKKGIHLIYNHFKDFLHQQGLREIEALNKKFDLDVHEAVGKTPAPEENLKGKIVDVIEKGYSLKDKVVRYSKVIIGE